MVEGFNIVCMSSLLNTVYCSCNGITYKGRNIRNVYTNIHSHCNISRNINIYNIIFAQNKTTYTYSVTITGFTLQKALWVSVFMII